VHVDEFAMHTAGLQRRLAMACGLLLISRRRFNLNRGGSSPLESATLTCHNYARLSRRGVPPTRRLLRKPPRSTADYRNPKGDPTNDYVNDSGLARSGLAIEASCHRKDLAKTSEDTFLFHLEILADETRRSRFRFLRQKQTLTQMEYLPR